MDSQSAIENYDLIFAGAGMSAASLLLRLLDQSEFRDKKILIADPDPFAGKAKTWCFWEQGSNYFEPLVHKSWEKAWFKGSGFSLKLQLLPYRYKMIRSESLFAHTFSRIASCNNVHVLPEAVLEIREGKPDILLDTSSGKTFRSPLVFNSIPPQTEKKPGHFYLLQHFTGWFVQTKEKAFRPEEPVLMDFSINQKEDCRFMYLLPFSETEALVEYTLFSDSLLKEAEYEAELQSYLDRAAPAGYEIIQKEHGIIPMFSEPFPESSLPGMIYLGTRGNQTKASTGYTFRSAQKHADAITQLLLHQQVPDAASLHPAARFSWFDRVLLRILTEKGMGGREIFECLFLKNPVQRVFRFLDEESGIWEELKIMNSVPAHKFIIPGIRELLRPFSGR